MMYRRNKRRWHKARTHGTQRVLLQMLASSSIDWVSYDALFDGIWGDDPNGGVDDPINNLKVHLGRLRQSLRPHGITIDTVWGQGLRIPRDQRDRAREIADDATLRFGHNTSQGRPKKSCPHCGHHLHPTP